MIEKIKASKSEKIIFIFVLTLGLFSITSFFLLKDKCLFVKNYDPNKINFKNPNNIAILNVECGNVIIELDPNTSPNAVKRFKTLINNGSYNGSAFYRVLENTLIQAGDLEYGNIENLNYAKIGTGKSELGSFKSELSDDFEFKIGSVAFARKDQFDT